jgi:UDP-2-acetamido-2-deoxy-ribo-hexuluronate aminotransferase
MYKYKIADLKKDYSFQKKKIDYEIQDTLNSGEFILGSKVKKLEKLLAEFLGCKYAVGLSSGTDALLASLLACDIKPNDEIIIPSLTWISTASMITLIGAKPIFVDVNLHNGLIEIDKIENKITNKTRAIISVGLYGLLPDFQILKKISIKHNLYLIDDGAQSFGSKFNKKYSTNYCNLVCTSFFPGKIMGCYGDGGAVFTNSKYFYQKIIKIRNHGQLQKSNSIIQGINGRLDNLQAAILIPKIKNLKNEIIKRKKIYKMYEEKLSKKISILQPHSKCEPNYSSIPIIAIKRDKLKNYLNKKKIQTQIIYSKSIPEQKFFKKLKINKKDYKNSKMISNKVISIPCHGYLKMKDINYIINSVNTFYDKK